MARKTFDLADVSGILTRWYAGLPISTIAMDVGVDRKTVRKYIAPALADGLRPGGIPMSPAEWRRRVVTWFPQVADARLRQTTWPELAAHHAEIARLLKAGVAQATIHQWLRDDAGLTASLASLKRYVAANLPGHRRRLLAFVVVLACWRTLLLRPAAATTQPAWQLATPPTPGVTGSLTAADATAADVVSVDAAATGGAAADGGPADGGVDRPAGVARAGHHDGWSCSAGWRNLRAPRWRWRQTSGQRHGGGNVGGQAATRAAKRPAASGGDRPRRTTRLAGAVTLAAVAVLAAGCANPAGSDGDLMNGWQAIPAPQPYQPVDHGCYTLPPAAIWSTNKLTEPVACTESHNVETYLVGTFTGADAERTTAPPDGGAERRRANEQCMTAATAYLGDEWHAGRVDVVLTTPKDNQWSGGGRWFRCDLVEWGVNDSVVARTTSLKGALTGSRPVALGCLKATEKDDDIEFGATVPCEQAHDAEYAGVYTAPDGPYPTDTTARTKLRSDGCHAVVAAFAGVPNDQDLKYRTGLIYGGLANERWTLGDRTVRCYIWPGKPVSRSLKGAGPGVLPAT